MKSNIQNLDTSIPQRLETIAVKLERIRNRFVPLVKICKEYGTARTNNGSLSDRIMSRYGDSPIGMVESAMEFLRIAEDLNFYNNVLSMKPSNPLVSFEDGRVQSTKIFNIGGDAPPIVIADFPGIDNIGRNTLASAGYLYNEPIDKWTIGNTAADYIFVNEPLTFSPPGMIGIVIPASKWEKLSDQAQYFLRFTLIEYNTRRNFSDRMNMALIGHQEVNSFGENLNELQKRIIVLVIQADEITSARTCLKRISYLETSKQRIPCVFQCYADDRSIDDLIVNYAAYAGSIILNGWKDGISLIPPAQADRFDNLLIILNNIASGILQVTRSRISGTEYISRPSCGRTLFDLQTTTERVRMATNHLKGLKNAIIGCIVNGPGEMADADFGYVSSGPGKISLYKGKEIIRRTVNSEVAVDMLVSLIKEFGLWTDSP